MIITTGISTRNTKIKKQEDCDCQKSHGQKSSKKKKGSEVEN